MQTLTTFHSISGWLGGAAWDARQEYALFQLAHLRVLLGIIDNDFAVVTSVFVA
jgi:hypothetical protein